MSNFRSKKSVNSVIEEVYLEEQLPVEVILNEDGYPNYPEFDPIQTSNNDGVNTSVTKPFQCWMCYKHFGSTKDLRRHEKIHTDEKPYECEICTKSFRRSDHLNNHKKTHLRDSNPPTKNEDYYEQPIKYINTDEEQLEFEAKFHPEVTINEETHYDIEMIPEEDIPKEKPKLFQCRICFKFFSTSSNSNRHERTHTNERPFPCNYCKKTFRQNSHLRDHERTHKGERPYTCQICFKTFTRSSDMKKHARIHTGEKPFQCNLCFKTFTQKGHLNDHEKIHTGGQKCFLCHICYQKFNFRNSLIAHMNQEHSVDGDDS